MGGSAQCTGHLGDARRRRTSRRSGDGGRRQRDRQVQGAAQSRTAAAERAGVTEAVGTRRGDRRAGRPGRGRRRRRPRRRSAAPRRSSTPSPTSSCARFATPNDARFGELYGLNNANDADMDAPEGWDLAGLGGFPATGGVKVGIVDTGIDAPRGPGGQDRRLRRCPAADQRRARGHLHRPQRPRHARRGDDRGQGQQRRRRRGRLLQLALSRSAGRSTRSARARPRASPTASPTWPARA